MEIKEKQIQNRCQEAFFSMRRITNVWNGLPGSIVKAKTQGTFANGSDGIMGELNSKRGNEHAYCDWLLANPRQCPCSYVPGASILTLDKHT